MSKRREFLKATGAALGGIAISSIAPIEAQGQQKPGEMARMAAKPGTYHVTVSRDVKLESLQAALKTIVGRSGCVTCGLLGVDILFQEGDPERVEVGGPGLRQTTFIAR